MTQSNSHTDTKDHTHPIQPVEPQSIRLWQPKIDNIPITSKAQLHQILDTEYPGLKHNPKFPQLLTDTHRHHEPLRNIDD